MNSRGREGGSSADSDLDKDSKFKQGEVAMRRRNTAITLSLIIAALTASVIGAAQTGEQAQDISLPTATWKRGLAISPVSLNLDGRNRRRVGLGSYLVNATACADCHTNPLYLPGGDPFSGQTPQVNVSRYLAGGRAFGPFISRNLTPEPPGGMPAGLTLDQFVQAMRTGKDFDNKHPQMSPLLQVMPWPTFANLSDDDLQNIYEYLSAIPHAEPAP